MTTEQYIDVERTLKRMETEVQPENAKAIRDFTNHQAAEGLSESHQQRSVQALMTLLTKFAPEGFTLLEATEDELKEVVAGLNRSDYAEGGTKHKARCALKKFYKIQNGGEHPDKVKFFSVHKDRKPTPVTREDLYKKEELKELFCSFSNTRDRAFAMVFYESAGRPGEVLSRTIGDFTADERGDFIFLEGEKGTPDRTNQLVRAGRTLREWIAQHPLGGELGDISDPSAPLWVKMEQQACLHCGRIPHHHDDDACSYEPDSADSMNYAAYRRRYRRACERAGIPENKWRPYNLRHTRLTEVATFMGYEQLNKFAGWKPGSDRAKVYVHLNNDDVNKAIREEYGLDGGEQKDRSRNCPFCGATNQAGHTECRQCGRPMDLEQQVGQSNKLTVLERLQELEDRGVLQKLEELESPTNQGQPAGGQSVVEA